MSNRYEILIENEAYDERDFSDDPTNVNGEWAMMELVADWIRKNHRDVRDDVDPNSNTPLTKTYDFQVSITDTEDGAEADQTVYADPDEPDDADGDWEYRGCINDIEYFVCGSLSGDDDWWKIDDHSVLRDTDGWSLITYTQDEWFVAEAALQVAA